MTVGVCDADRLTRLSAEVGDVDMLVDVATESCGASLKSSMVKSTPELPKRGVGRMMVLTCAQEKNYTWQTIHL